jgi:hypothetical protein
MIVNLNQDLYAYLIIILSSSSFEENKYEDQLRAPPLRLRQTTTPGVLRRLLLL